MNASTSVLDRAPRSALLNIDDKVIQSVDKDIEGQPSIAWLLSNLPLGPDGGCSRPLAMMHYMQTSQDTDESQLIYRFLTLTITRATLFIHSARGVSRQVGSAKAIPRTRP